MLAIPSISSSSTTTAAAATLTTTTKKTHNIIYIRNRQVRKICRGLYVFFEIVKKIG
jgi:hypothetical protein